MSINIIAQILKKDLRFSQWYLLFWAALLLLEIWFAVLGGDPALPFVPFFIPKLKSLIDAIMLLVAFPLVIQEDPLVGTTAFWFTKPIGRGSLLAAKLLFALLVIVIPSLLAQAVVAWAAGHVAASQMIQALPHVFLFRCVAILGIAVLASVTPSFGRFALVLACGWPVLAICCDVVSNLRLGYHPNLHPVDVPLQVLVPQRAQIFYGLFVFAALAALAAHQYLTRRTVRTKMAALVLLALLVVRVDFWLLQ